MSEKILVVDDDPNIIKIIESQLVKTGYTVLKAVDGLEGLFMAREHNPDLIILDVMMPKMDGFNVCRMLKFDKQFENTPVIMLTSKGDESDKATGQEVQADAYIVKPFNGHNLIDEIKKLLNSRPSQDH